MRASRLSEISSRFFLAVAVCFRLVERHHSYIVKNARAALCLLSLHSFLVQTHIGPQDSLSLSLLHRKATREQGSHEVARRRAHARGERGFPASGG
jgi:hypothetical protein